jgi:FKBP-type peptidyl-prolyl cis-trans isomerase
MKKFVSGILAGTLSAIILSGCSDLTGSLENHEKQEIADYIKSLGDTIYELKPSGLYYIELTPGTGIYPDDGDTVTFWSKGCLLDNRVFTTNQNQASPYPYIMGTGLKTGEVLKGFDEGLRYIRAGGTSRVVLPSDLAFGKYGYGTSIPGYTPVYYEIKLVSVKPGP